MIYRVAAFDLDGTLLNSKKEITPAVQREILRVRENGARIVLASGRPLSGILPVAAAIGLESSTDYLLCFNGALLQSATGETILDIRFTAEQIREIAVLAEETGLKALTYGPDALYADAPEDTYVQLESRLGALPVTAVQRMAEDISFSSNKVLLVGDPEKVASVIGTIRQRIDSFSQVSGSAPFFVEIVPKGVSKAAALQVVLERENILREELVCFGDGENDREMVCYAGLGVAMGNAVPQLRQVADRIGPSCDEDGVAVMLQEIWPEKSENLLTTPCV